MGFHQYAGILVRLVGKDSQAHAAPGQFPQGLRHALVGLGDLELVHLLRQRGEELLLDRAERARLVGEERGPRGLVLVELADQTVRDGRQRGLALLALVLVLESRGREGSTRTILLGSVFGLL